MLNAFEEYIKSKNINIKILKKIYFFLIIINLIVNHFYKLISIFSFVVLFLTGFVYFNLKNAKLKLEFDKFIKSTRGKYINSSGLIKIDSNDETIIEYELESSPSSSTSVNSKFDQKSINSLNIKPSLTGLYLVDDELHKIIDLIIRDFIDEWYKREISNKEDFSNYIRVLIYYSIRQINHSLKLIDWDQFITNILTQNILIQIRLLKKAREKLKNSQKSDPNAQIPSNQSYDFLFKNAQSISQLNDRNLVESFFEVEAEFEKGLCRDNFCLDHKEEQDDFLQELSEMLCYCLMPSKTFNCFPLRCIIREVFSHILVKTMIDKVTDPDYINQSVLYLSRDDSPLVENFITTINFCESLDELSELSLRIKKEIALTRSNDKGGNDLNDVKLQLSSLSYLKRKIDAKISNLVKSLNKLDKSKSATPKDHNMGNEEENKMSNINLDLIDLDSIIKNEAMQNCFIEFMSRKNVQNLISFYLNADMYRQFAKKELTKLDSKELGTSIKELLKDFSKNLINSYLLNASNFTAMSSDNDDQPVNISNRIYYKRELSIALEKIDNLDLINETVLDDLQSKIYILMEEKYLPEFKNSTEFHKLLLKINFKFLQNRSEIDDIDSFININDPSMIGEEVETITTIDNDTNSFSVDRVSLSSFDLCTVDTKSSINDPKYIKINACITSTGRCNDLKKSYSIYIIDITKLNELSGKVDYWQTYRRFNDFHDFHLIVKKNFPDLNIQQLPGKSFRNSLNEDLIEKRITELNKYLKMITSEEMLKQNPDLLELILKFLENRRWEYSSPTSLKRRFDSFLTPMISSVQTLQTSIKNAPDNVIGMVKGISDNLLNDLQPSNNNTIKQVKSTNALNTLKPDQEQSGTISPKNSSEAKLNEIQFAQDLQANNLPIKGIMLLMDEIFDLKEKNQWLRQSLMTIIKSFLKSFKGDSLNRKIKEQIAVYLKEESMARYLKNLRKRLWPNGSLAETHLPRAKNAQEITKLLVKTKLLSFVSDEFRHILGNDATRRGIFNLFDLFQHKAFNKRLFYVLIENLFICLFFKSQNRSTLLPVLYRIPKQTSHNSSINQNICPFDYLLHLHSSKSYRVKPEWKIYKIADPNQANKPESDTDMSLIPMNEHFSQNESRRNSIIPKSKSLYNEIKC